MMQPNPGWKIMVTFKMDPCIARVDVTFCISFEDSRLVDRIIGLNFCIAG